MEESKFCKYCGEQIPKDSVVCPKCGRQLVTVKAKAKPEKEHVEDQKAMENDAENEAKKVEKTKTDAKSSVPIGQSVTDAPKDQQQEKFYTKSWFMWVMLFFITPVGLFLLWKYHPEMKKGVKIAITVIFVLYFIIAGIIGLASDDTTSSPGQSGEVKQMEVTVADFSTMDRTGVENWCNENKVDCSFRDDYSDSVAEGGFISQSIKAGEKIQEGNTVIVTYSLGAKPSVEYQNALARAKTYSDIMHMSKKAIYDQLTSEYGDKFSADAAQYAVDHLNADWKANALASAKTYQETMHMSKSAIYDQLVSEYGEKFTAEEAQYAIDNLSD